MVFFKTFHLIWVYLKICKVGILTLDVTLPLPTQIESVMNKEKVSVKISTYDELKAFLNSK